MAAVQPHLSPPNSLSIVAGDLPQTTTSPPKKRPRRKTDLEADRRADSIIEDSDGEGDWKSEDFEGKFVSPRGNPETLFKVGFEKVCTYKQPEWRTTYPSMEVFSVIVHKPIILPLYGFIQILGGFGSVKLFEREKPSVGVPTTESSVEDMMFDNQFGETELLQTGPTQECFEALDRVYIDIELTNNSHKTCWNYFRWESPVYSYPSMSNYIYDSLLFATIKHDEVGEFTVKYAVFDDPLIAKVEVVLLQQHINKGDDECEKSTYLCADHVTGTIYAKNSYYDNKSVLFFRKDKRMPDNMVEGKGVISDDGYLIIPLSKSIVSLPHDATLEIGVNLKDSNSGVTICDGRVDFTGPEILRQHLSHEEFPDPRIIDDKIRVTVTWSRQ